MPLILVNMRNKISLIERALCPLVYPRRILTPGLSGVLNVSLINLGLRLASVFQTPLEDQLDRSCHIAGVMGSIPLGLFEWSKLGLRRVTVL